MEEIKHGFKKDISVFEVLQLVFENKYYLKDFPLNIASVKNFEHAIYFEKEFGENGVFLDLFFNRKKLKIYSENFNIIQPNEFINIIVKDSYPSTIPRSYLKRFSDLPKEIKKQAQYVLSYSQKIIEALEDKNYWFPLDRDKNIYIQKTNDKFWKVLQLKDNDINSIYPEKKECIMKKVYKVIIDNPSTVEEIPINILRKIETYEERLYTVLNRIINNESYLELYKSVYSESRIEKRILVFFNSNYYSCLLINEKIETFYSIEEVSIIEEILKIIVKNEEVKINVIDENLKKELQDKIIDSVSLIKLIKEKKARIGGGFTTDQQWSLYYTDGSFYINGNKIEEDKVKKIIEEHSYRWIKYEDRKIKRVSIEKAIGNIKKINKDKMAKKVKEESYKTIWSNLNCTILIKTVGVECSSPMGGKLIKFKDFLKGEFNDWVNENFPDGTLEEVKNSIRNLDKIPGFIEKKKILESQKEAWKSIPVNRSLKKFITRKCKIYQSLKDIKEEYIKHHKYFYRVYLDSIEVRNINGNIVFPEEDLLEKMNIGAQIRIIDIQVCDRTICAYYENYFYEGNVLDKVTGKKGYLEISPTGFVSRYKIN